MRKPVPPDRTSARRHTEWILFDQHKVEIRCNGQAIRTGFVEDEMADSAVLWTPTGSSEQRPPSVGVRTQLRHMSCRDDAAFRQ
jgi:hypothetical protein